MQYRINIEWGNHSFQKIQIDAIYQNKHRGHVKNNKAKVWQNGHEHPFQISKHFGISKILKTKSEAMSCIRDDSP